MRISDWSSDVCSSDLREQRFGGGYAVRIRNIQRGDGADAAGRADLRRQRLQRLLPAGGDGHCGYSFRKQLGKMGAETAGRPGDEGGLSCQIQKIAHIDSIGSSLRAEEHTSELQSLMRISYAF